MKTLIRCAGIVIALVLVLIPLERVDCQEYTDENGYYLFQSVTEDIDCCVTPSATLGGFRINVNDGLNITNYLLGFTSLSDCQMIAADVDGNAIVDETDRDIIFAYIMGGPAHFIEQWRFIPEQRCYTPLSANETNEGETGNFDR